MTSTQQIALGVIAVFGIVVVLPAVLIGMMSR